MRFLLLLAALFGPVAYAQQADGFDVARRLLQAGAGQLALDAVDAAQPATPGAGRWREWEGLRCEALSRLGADQSLVERARKWPSGRDAVEASCLLRAAQAAQATGAVDESRRFAARLIWSGQADVSAVRAARVLIIDGYVAQRRTDDAVRSMLRFQQDYAPLDAGTAARFIEGLLELGRERDAVNWLALVEANSPARAWLRLRTGLTTPQEAVTQSRALLARGAPAGHWRVIEQAARTLKDQETVLEALEHRLNEERNDRAAGELARELWTGYLATAREIGNREQLLMGEDARWSDYAARRFAGNPVLARAFFAYLAEEGRQPESRRNAELQLVFSLQQAKLGGTALQIFGRQRTDCTKLDAQTRYYVGSIALDRGRPARAYACWDGLAAPPSVSGGEFSVRVARAALEAGKSDGATAAFKRLAGTAPLGPETAAAALQLGQDMVDAARFADAIHYLEALRPLAGSLSRGVSVQLGRAREGQQDFPGAAREYLATVLPGDTVTDDVSLQSRWSAARNLVRAGYMADARAQYDVLTRQTRDARMAEAARRELRRYP